MSVGKIRNNSIGGFPMAGQKQQPGGNHSGIRAVLSLGDVMVHSTVSCFKLGKLYYAVKIVLHSASFVLFFCFF